jgi:S1-C subfamily serine protease
MRRLLAALAPLFGALLLLGTPPGAGAEEPAPPAESEAEKAYAEALEKARAIEDALVKAVDRVRRSSVSIFQQRRINGDLVLAGAGSGVLVERRGKPWILTNVHVIEGNEGLIAVTCDGESHEVVAHDTIPSYDIALLKFRERAPRGIRTVTVKASTSKRGLAEGTWVIATGNPFFLAADGESVTTLGVVSGLDRYLGGEYEYVGVIQHDAEVNPGNSGGPLWNLDGDLAGINGKIAMGYRFPGAQPSNTGAAFSLTVEQVERFLDRLIDKRDAQAGFLGIECETEVDGKGNPTGARVSRIHERSPVLGQRDQPLKDDVITMLTLKGTIQRIYTASDLVREISTSPAGTPVKLRFRRGSKWMTWSGALGAEGR